MLWSKNKNIFAYNPPFTQGLLSSQVVKILSKNDYHTLESDFSQQAAYIIPTHVKTRFTPALKEELLFQDEDNENEGKQPIVMPMIACTAQLFNTLFLVMFATTQVCVWSSFQT